MEASLLYRSSCILAEGPFWHPNRKSLFWLDIDGKMLYEFNCINKAVEKRPLPYRASMIAEDNHGNLVLGVQGGLARFDLDTEKFTWFLDIEKENPDQRCNDGKCDFKGRLWFGTMDAHGKEHAGSLYCFDTNLGLTRKIDKLTIPNGIAWSIDRKRLYHVDSPSMSVKSYLFNETSGDIEFEKIVITIPAGLGLPDGMAIDTRGMLWIAHYGGHGVYCWNPKTGDLVTKVNVPAPNVTSCAFGGEKLDHLFITSAKKDLSEEQLEKFPLSGSVFVVVPGVKGLPSNKFPLS